MKFVVIAIVIIAVGVLIFSTREPALQNSSPSNSSIGDKPTIPIRSDEVSAHNTATDCWTIISNNVYDVTDYVQTHPGGQSIVAACGIDATSIYKERPQDGRAHSKYADNILDEYIIGTLSQ